MGAPGDVDYEAAIATGRKILAERGVLGDTLTAVAACGLWVQIWRDTIEPANNG